MDRSIEHHVNLWNRAANLELQPILVNPVERDRAPAQGLEEGFFFNADPAAEDADHFRSRNYS